ncbi:MAG: DUF5615 family PIN-like protein [Verrucomicrobia bacterium]|nr:DUF5615 family PIN-like protein [Verrucomicrobiota bacterium]
MKPRDRITVEPGKFPAALASWLSARGTDAVHVLDLALDLALDTTPDIGIWSRASDEERIVVSKDEDFFHLAHREGDTGRLLWVRMGNCRTAASLARYEGFGYGERCSPSSSPA